MKIIISSILLMSPLAFADILNKDINKKEESLIDKLCHVDINYDGISLYGNNALAKELFKALKGDSNAQYIVALHYLQSKTRPRNLVKGREWAYRSAIQNNTEAMVLLSSNYSMYGIENRDHYIIDKSNPNYPVPITVLPLEQKIESVKAALHWAYRAKIRGNSMGIELADINFYDVSDYEKIKKEVFDQEKILDNTWKNKADAISETQDDEDYILPPRYIYLSEKDTSSHELSHHETMNDKEDYSLPYIVRHPTENDREKGFPKIEVINGKKHRILYRLPGFYPRMDPVTHIISEEGGEIVPDLGQPIENLTEYMLKHSAGKSTEKNTEKSDQFPSE